MTAEAAEAVCAKRKVRPRRIAAGERVCRRRPGGAIVYDVEGVVVHSTAKYNTSRGRCVAVWCCMQGLWVWGGWV